MAIDLDAIRRKLNNLQSQTKRTDNLWKPKPGSNQVRIVPYQYDKDNPDADRFDAMDDPEYKKLEAEYDSYRGMDGKIAKSKVMKHPGGEIRNGKLTYFNPKGGKPMKWDGEQYEIPDKFKDSVDRSDHNRLLELAGINQEQELNYDIVNYYMKEFLKIIVLLTEFKNHLF